MVITLSGEQEYSMLIIAHCGFRDKARLSPTIWSPASIALCLMPISRESASFRKFFPGRLK
jgi:hypothetical protein